MKVFLNVIKILPLYHHFICKHISLIVGVLQHVNSFVYRYK